MRTVIHGMEIIVNAELGTWSEDWSRVRSPGRARRRLKKHRQRIGRTFTPDPKWYVLEDRTLITHPANLGRLEAALRADARLREQCEARGLSPDLARRIQRVWRESRSWAWDILDRTGRVALELRETDVDLRSADNASQLAWQMTKTTTVIHLSAERLSSGSLVVLWNGVEIEGAR